MKPNKEKSDTSATTEEGDPLADSCSTKTSEDQQSEKNLKYEWNAEKSDKNPKIGPEIVSGIFDIDLNKILKSDFEVPKLHRMSHSEGIELLGELLGMYDLEYNLISYWTLEVLLEIIKKAQSKCMNEINQKMSIIWIVYVLMKINLHKLRRKQLFKHLCLLFIRGLATIPTLAQLPNPFDLQYDEDELEKGSDAEEEEEEFLDIPSESLVFDESVSYTTISEIIVQEEEEEEIDEIARLPEEIQEQIQLLSLEIAQIRENNDRDFYQLIKMIYRIFANRFKYAVIWEAFTHPPSFKKIRITDNILVPKISLMLKPSQKDKGVTLLSTAVKSQLKYHGKTTTVKSNIKSMGRLPRNKMAGKKRSLLKIDFNRPTDPEKERKMRQLSKYIQPLKEAVNNQFFHWIADSLFKENIGNAYSDEIHSVITNIEPEDPEKVKRAPHLIIDENESKEARTKKKSELTSS